MAGELPRLVTSRCSRGKVGGLELQQMPGISQPAARPISSTEQLICMLIRNRSAGNHSRQPSRWGWGGQGSIPHPVGPPSASVVSEEPRSWPCCREHPPGDTPAPRPAKQRSPPEPHQVGEITKREPKRAHPAHWQHQD